MKKKLAVLAFLFGAVAVSIVWYLKPRLPTRSLPTPRPVARLMMTLHPNEPLTALGRPALAISPDGTKLVYVSSRRGVEQLYLRAMDQLAGGPMPGAEGGFSPFFSPDGQWVGFFAAGKLKKIAVDGKGPRTLCDALNPVGASWGPDDTIVFAPLPNSGLWRVSAAGGTPEVLTTLDPKNGENSHRWPEVLPGGKAVLFTVGTRGNWDDAPIVAQSLETGERRVVIQGGAFARYVPTGHLVYARSGTLHAVPFDLARLEVTGDTVPVVHGLLQTSGGAAQFSFSNLGLLVYVPGSARARSTMFWVDRNGAAQRLVAPPGIYNHPRLSPDGQRLVVAINEGATSDVWVYDIARGTLTTRLTTEASNNWPLWTRDGHRVTFSSSRRGSENLFWKAADGGADEQLTRSEHRHTPQSWSPDGQVLAFVENHPATGLDIWMLSIGDDRKAEPFLRTPSHEGGAVFSPDGRWIAYASNESRQFQIYAQPYPQLGRTWQISTDGGTEPLWARNGRELFYRNGDKVMVVDVTTQPTFSVAKPRVLFEGRYVTTTGLRGNYDVAPDGKRFLMVRSSEQELAPTQLNVVVEWFEDLKNRIRSAKP